MRQYSKSLAGVVALALFIAVSATHAADLAHRDRDVALAAPLTAESFTAAVLARNASLRAMRQALVAAVSGIRPAGALPDPMLSVSAALHAFGSVTGTGGDTRVSQTPLERIRCAQRDRSWAGGGCASRPRGAATAPRGPSAGALCGLYVPSPRACHQPPATRPRKVEGGFVRRGHTKGADV